MNVLEKEIIATLAFFSTFEKALNIGELFENLYRENLMSETHSEAEIIAAVKELEQKGWVNAIWSENGMAVKLAGTSCVDRSKYNEKLMAKVYRWSWIFKICPFLELVGVCNTLGFGGAKEGSDIDLFIVTAQGRLFTGRTFITILTQLLGLRRHGDKVSERFCLSFFVDSSDLAVHRLAIEDDIYFTYWLKNLRIVYASEGEAITNFADTNKYWVSKYLHHPNFSTEFVTNGKYLPTRIMEAAMNNFVGDFLEKRLRSWQLKRAQTKAMELRDLTGTVLTETVLKFHNVDRRSEIRNEWKKKITRGVHTNKLDTH